MAEEQREISFDSAERLIVPIYERAEIRPRELAALRRQLAELEHRLTQTAGERDAYERIIRALLAGLGFARDWPVSLAGADEAVATLLQIAAGNIQREDCGTVTAGTVIAAIFDQREHKQGSCYSLRKERRGR